MNDAAIVRALRVCGETGKCYDCPARDPEDGRCEDKLRIAAADRDAWKQRAEEAEIDRDVWKARAEKAEQDIWMPISKSLPQQGDIVSIMEKEEYIVDMVKYNPE